MSILIACSGACHSGKTTLIHTLKDRISGSKVLDELIRTKHIPNLTELREQDPDAYLDIEIDIITTKMAQETEVLNDGLRRLVIADRSLADSLYYLTRYTQVNRLRPLNVVRYYQLIGQVTETWDTHYNRIIFLNPIPVPSDLTDHFRIKELQDIQTSEAEAIYVMASRIAPIRRFSTEDRLSRVLDFIHPCLL